MAQGGRSVLGLCGRLCRKLGVVLVLGLAPLAAGCYGYFPLTRTLYEVNGAVPIGLLRTVVFWVFSVSAYPAAMLVDALALNVIEFWTGVHAPGASITDENGTTYAMVPSADGREMTLTISHEGGEIGMLRFVRLSDRELELRNADGTLAGRMVRDAGGSVRLTDARGATMALIDAAQFDRLAGATAR